MELLLTSNPKIGSVLKIEFVDILDVVTLPQPDADNNIDFDAIILAPGKTWDVLIPLPKTGRLTIENVETTQGWYERPKIICQHNNTGMQILNNLADKALGRYIIIATTGSGEKYLIGDLEQYLSFTYKLDTTNTRAQTKVLDLEFSFS